MNKTSSSRLEKVTHLRENIYQAPKFALCDTHNLSKSYICSINDCAQKGQLRCKDCTHSHPLININKVVPLLSHWISQQWQEVEKEDRQIMKEWKNTEINLKYCIDIFKELLKQVQQKHSQGRQLLYLPVLESITSQVHNMFDIKLPQVLVRQFQQLNDKFNLFSKENNQKEQVQCLISKQERLGRMKKNKKIATKSKKFSENALLFSEELAKTIQDKLAQDKRLIKIKKLQTQKIMSLNDFYKKTKQELQNMGQNMAQLLIQFNKKSQKEQANNLQQFLKGCQNLKSLHINNQNGNVMPNIWNKITNQLQHLKNLKQLKLNIRAKDLKFLIKLFEKRPNAIRHIDRLSLKITDQPALDLNEVATFCNCFQLKCLFLTLTRDNISKKNAEEFLQKLRVHTSMTNLPMNEFTLNLNKNTISSLDARLQVQQVFRKKCDAVKKKSILI